MKLQFMKTCRAEFSIDRMARLLGVSRATFYRFLKNIPSNRDLENAALEARIHRVHREQRGCGVLKVQASLASNSIRYGKNRIWKLMRKAGILGKKRRKFRIRTTESNHEYAVSPNLLKRNFRVDRPNRVWVSDITYIKTRMGWSYLCTVLDLFARKIVGWSLMDQMPAALAVAALEMAVASRRPARGLIFHSDRGVQYASCEFRAVLEKHGMTQSMSRKGNCWDNACAESFFSLMKEEVGQEEFDDLADARGQLFDYIELFYNAKRIHGTLDYMSPNQYEKEHVA